MRQCQVPGCTRDAEYEVFLYDSDPRPGRARASMAQDRTCLFICQPHAEENEQQAEGERRPRGNVAYLYTNREHAPGFTIYRPLESAATTPGPSFTASRQEA
jgi:hypothetical protein